MKKFKRFMQVFLCTVLMGSLVFFGNGKAFAEDQSITIKKGDTLYSISKKHNISIEDLKEYNRLKSNKIIAGQSLIILDIELTKPLHVAVAGSFSKKSNADKRVTFLKKIGIEAIVVKKIINDKTT